MTKRFLALVCAVITSAALCGCKSGSENSPLSEPNGVPAINERENPVEKIEDMWEWEEEEDGSLTLNRCKVKSAAVKIPSEINGKPVKALDYSFYVPDTATSVEIPASVEEIKDYKIGGDNLAEIIVAADNPNYYSKDGILYVKSDAFILYEKDSLYCCPRGKSGEIVIPDGTTGINSFAFSGCGKITSVKLPESVAEIDTGAFSRCTALTSVNIPKAVTEISGYTFQGCTSLETLDIPETVTDISQYPFEGTAFQNNIIEKETFVIINGILVDATAAKGEVTIPDSVRKIGYKAFVPYMSENTWLTKAVIPDSVTEMHSSVFEDCTALEEVRLSADVTELGWYLFRNCKSLKRIDIPDGVTKIGMDAFENCENLELVNVPDSVCEFDLFGCFEGCGKVNVVYKGKTYTADNIDEFYSDAMAVDS